MPIVKMRVRNFRAFLDSGDISIGPVTPIVGRNDAGKSGLLHALGMFFDPPKKGLSVFDLHGKDESAIAQVEVSFNPSALSTLDVQIDAKNKIHLVDDRLVDSAGCLTLRLSVSSKKVTAFDILIQDVDDDALFPLALKAQEELLGLLEANGLPAVKSGKETNQQKRATLRAKAQVEKRGLREAWTDATAVEKELRDVLPEFVFFADTANYGIGETPVQNQFKAIVDKALSTHANAMSIENDIRTTIQSEFDKVFDLLKRLTDSVTMIEADAKVNWKKAVENITLSWGDQAGISIPYESRGAGVRRLFMVAYFQYEAAASIMQESGPRYIFAIEEPEVHLHPGAQRDLDVALRDLADLGHAAIFTTHSPVFASTAPIRDVVLVTRPGSFAEVKQSPALDAAKIAEELGVEASDRLVGKNFVILVEGKRDVEFYTSVLKLLHDASLVSLDPRSVLFLQCGGIDSLRFSVTSRCIDEAGLRWAVIADSDRVDATTSVSRAALDLQASCPDTCLSLTFLSRTCIENYLDEGSVKAITGIDCAIPVYGKPTNVDGSPLANERLSRIKMNVAKIVQHMGVERVISRSKGATGDSEFVAIFESIRQKFGL